MIVVNTRPKASLTIRVSEVFYNKIRDIAEKMEINMREAADVFLNDLSATIARQQVKIEVLEEENKELKKEVEKWKRKVAQI